MQTLLLLHEYMLMTWILHVLQALHLGFQTHFHSYYVIKNQLLLMLLHIQKVIYVTTHKFFKLALYICVYPHSIGIYKCDNLLSD
jgi:hypothetical protein